LASSASGAEVDERLNGAEVGERSNGAEVNKRENRPGRPCCCCSCRAKLVASRLEGFSERGGKHQWRGSGRNGQYQWRGSAEKGHLQARRTERGEGHDPKRNAQRRNTQRLAVASSTVHLTFALGGDAWSCALRTGLFAAAVIFMYVELRSSPSTISGNWTSWFNGKFKHFFHSPHDNGDWQWQDTWQVSFFLPRSWVRSGDVDVALRRR
jgi:hypothetical protein